MLYPLIGGHQLRRLSGSTRYQTSTTMAANVCIFLHKLLTLKLGGCYKKARALPSYRTDE